MALMNLAWLEYAIFDENADIIGIREDAPEEMKQAYYRYLEMKKNHIK